MNKINDQIYHFVFQLWKPETLWTPLPIEAALADPGAAMQLERLE